MIMSSIWEAGTWAVIVTNMVTVVCLNLVGKVPKKKLVRPQPDTLPCLPLYLGLLSVFSSWNWDYLGRDFSSNGGKQTGFIEAALKRIDCSCNWPIVVREVQHDKGNDGGSYFESWTSWERVSRAMSAWWLVPAPWVWSSPAAWSSSPSSQSSSSFLQQHQL